MTVQQISAHYFNKVINYYTDILTEKYGFKPLTPVLQIEINQTFEKIASEVKKRETHPVWFIPLKINYNLASQQFSIVLKDPNSVQFI